MATFYATTGTAQGTGDGSSEANRIELKKAVENDAGLHTALVAGSNIYCKNDGTLNYDGSSGLAHIIPVIEGTASAYISVIGYTTTITDGGLITLNDTSTGSGAAAFSQTKDYYLFRNIKGTNNRGLFDLSTASQANILINCHSVNSRTEGFDIKSSVANAHAVIDCSSVGANSQGFIMGSRNSRLIRCVSIGSGVEGFNAGNSAYGSVLVDCISHANGGHGFELNGESILTNCTANRNTGDGFNVNEYTVLHGCVASSNSAYGVNGSAVPVFANNSALNPTNETNTSGKSNSVTLIEVDEITGDPLYTDSNPATATDVDLSLGSGSSLLAAITSLGGDGFTATTTSTNAGPVQSAAGGSGGETSHVFAV